MYRNGIKRLLAVILSLCGMIVLSPLLLILCIAIKVDSPGPILFKQKRVGIHKQHFNILKFRTMRMDTPHDMPTHMLKDPDQYITRVGHFLRKTSLDKLPQLWNILVGDMSFVGPRPERQYFYEQFEKYIIGFSNRLVVTPGLTGYAQVNGGYELEPEEKIVYDMEYIEKRSVLMDIKCLAKTVSLIFTHEGAR